MIQIPGGTVTLGVTAKQMIALAEKYVKSESQRDDLVHALASELGQKTVDVPSFWLAKDLVTNEQYLQFIEANKGKHRFPFHWWKEGKKDSYDEALEAARKEFPGDNPRLKYWEQHWRELPYAIPEGKEQYPVTWVNWDDAQAYAGWAGMRLPTEAEWMLAATGGDGREFVWGGDWAQDELQQLKLAKSSEQTLKPVGQVPVATGPYGNEDMVGQIFEWTAGIGFHPVAGQEEFDREFRKLKSEKPYANLIEPRWDDNLRVMKGGSYFQWAQPAMLRAGTRGYLEDYRVMEGAGFRVAKSMVPARDMAIARLAVEYDSSVFEGERKPNVDDEIGVERYDFSPDGKLITDYHAIALTPPNHMGIERGVSLGKLREKAQESPLAIGVLMVTEPLAEPSLKPGMYTVYYREAGMPKELDDALRDAKRDMNIAKKTKKDVDPTAKWHEALAHYGITTDDLGKDKVEFVRPRPGKLEVPTDKSMYLFRANSAQGGAGDFVAAIPAGQELHTKSYDGASLAITTKDGKETMTFTWGVPWDEKSRTKTLVFEMPLRLTTAPDLTKPWRRPAGVTIQGPTKTAQNEGLNNSVGGK